jgi:hypothetical protein
MISLSPFSPTIASRTTIRMITNTRKERKKKKVSPRVRRHISRQWRLNEVCCGCGHGQWGSDAPVVPEQHGHFFGSPVPQKKDSGGNTVLAQPSGPGTLWPKNEQYH